MPPQLTCVDTFCNVRGETLYYFLQDDDGIYHVMIVSDLAAKMIRGEVHCTNLEYSIVNGIVPLSSTKKTAEEIADTHPSSAVAAYKLYMQRLKIAGIEPDAEYEIDGDDVVLKRVFTQTGTFEIQSFVTKIAHTVEYALTLYVPVDPIFVNAVNIQVINHSNITDISWLFAGCKAECIDLTNFDTSKVTNMYGLFYMCDVTEILGLDHLDTSNVTSMHSMFSRCKVLKSLDVSHFNTSKVLDFGSMFEACTALKSLDVSKFDTSSALEMSGMFISSENLHSLDVSHFNTSKVKLFNCMFSLCSSLEQLDTSNFDLSSAENLDSMFYNCLRLKQINLGTGIGSHIKSMSGIVKGCHDLQVLDWSFIDDNFKCPRYREMFESDVFKLCPNLKILYLNSCFNRSQVPKYIQILMMKCKTQSTEVQIRFK